MIGLIIPPVGEKVPPEGAVLYPHLAFEAAGLGIPQVSPDGFDEVAGAIVEKSRLLTERGAEAISIMGTSLTFYRGAGVNRELQQRVSEATGLPATTMSSAIVNALRQVGVTRAAVATAYIDDLNDRLRAFLRDEGFEITVVKGLSLTDVGAIQSVTPDVLKALARSTFAGDSSADGVLISCGGLLTLDILDDLERELGVPVVSSSPAGFWDVARLVGRDTAVDGYGRLFRM